MRARAALFCKTRRTMNSTAQLSELAVFTTLHLGMFRETLERLYDDATARGIALGVRELVSGMLDLPSSPSSALVGVRALSERRVYEALHEALAAWTRKRADTHTRPNATAMLAALDRSIA